MELILMRELFLTARLRKQYKKYKLAAGKTAKSILISCGARLAPFDIKELRDLMDNSIHSTWKS